jgi:predicted porin
MKTKLIVIAVAAALAPAAAMAEVTVYGRIHASVDSVSGIAAEKNNLSVNDNSSRFGVKGSEALDGGLKALYQIESGVSANGTAGSAFSGVRDSYIGLTGGFGTFMTGRLPAANQYVYDSNLFADQMGDAANFTGGSLLGIGRANSALHYVSPNFGGVNVALTYLPAKSAISSGVPNGKNSTGIKVNYAGNGITASLTTFNVSTDPLTAAVPASGWVIGDVVKVSPLSLAGGYDFGKGSVSAQYVKSKLTVNGVDADTTSVINIGGKFNVSDSGVVKAQFSKAGASLANAKDGATMLAIGYDHSLSKNTGVYLVYAKVTNDANGTYTMNNWGHQDQTTGLVAGEDPSGFGIGLSHNF